MKIEQYQSKIIQFQNLELLANQIVEGFISGMHKSPFHGFSSEFAEHKLYNNGESTKHVDWKLFAKTDRLYTKQYQEETNMRCHVILDNSSSMYYPILKENEAFYHSKIGFSVMATAVLMNLLKKQRDAIGLSVFSDTYEFYVGEKGSDRHHRMILDVLEQNLSNPKKPKSTDTIKNIHLIAEKMNRRSMILIFSDLFETSETETLINALQHLKHNKHRVILFHVKDKEKEELFNFDNQPRKFIDVESGEEINIFAENVKQNYENSFKTYLKKVEDVCLMNKIKYVSVDVGEDFEKIMTTYLVEKQKFG
jgi:uncharacterized protein (DUF58 family)